MALKQICAALVFAAALAPAALAEPAPPIVKEVFKVKVDQTVTLKLAGAADSVVIGNATVADVAVHDPSTLLVTGKAFGTTNLIVLDRGGRTIYQSNIAVAGSDDAGLTIVRGTGTYSYSCYEKCRATPTVGDAPGHFLETMQTVTGMAGSAKGGAQ